MKQITPSRNEHQWPRKNYGSVECRTTDLVLRITDWTKDKDEPAYDVECYIGGTYDFNESESCTVWEHKTKKRAKDMAIEFAQKQIAKLL